MKLNGYYDDLKDSYLFHTVAVKTAEYKEKHPDADIIKLGIGDVTRPLPEACVKAMKAACDEQLTVSGFRGYGPYEGFDFLREAISGYYACRGTKVAAHEIYVSDGAKSDIGNILDLFDRDNTVLVPDPVYPVYVDTNVMCGRRVIYAGANAENGFLPMPDDSVRADLIYICSPNNPTGAAYTREMLAEWVKYAEKNGALILYDAAYEAFITDGSLARSIYEIDGSRTCCIEFCSFSKNAGFTGERCGRADRRRKEAVRDVAAPSVDEIQRRPVRDTARRGGGSFRRRSGADRRQPRILQEKRGRHRRVPRRTGDKLYGRRELAVYLDEMP